MMDTDNPKGHEERAAKGKYKLWMFVPLALFLILSAIFTMQLLSGRNLSLLPSPLVGRQAPLTQLPALEGMDVPPFDTTAFLGTPTLVNVWASWCGPCRQEHPVLLELAKSKKIKIAGINYKDSPPNALSFIKSLGNPYDFIGVDESGRASIEWGVYGIPESYLVDSKGVVVWKHVGPLTPKAIQDDLLKLIKAE